MLAAMAAAMIITTQDLPSARWGLETMELVRREFQTHAGGGFAESIENGKKREPCFNWSLGVLLSAMNGAASVDPKWKPHLKLLLKISTSYWNPEGPVAGFDVLPLPKPEDRYYDDNAWMVLVLVEASRVLGDKEYLKQAEEALRFVLSGEDDQLGGGVFWREGTKSSKNTCSNAPAVAACVAVFEATGRPELLEEAKKLYAWTKSNLQDPGDLLYWDSRSLSGKIEFTKWSYNTALMIRSAAMLARATGVRAYLEDAEALAQASEKKWFVNGRIADIGRFGHLLLESWTYVPKPSRNRKARAAIKWLWEHGRTAAGFFGSRFDKPPGKEQKKFDLIDQASAARAFFIVPR